MLTPSRWQVKTKRSIISFFPEFWGNFPVCPHRSGHRPNIGFHTEPFPPHTVHHFFTPCFLHIAV
jgi:hypothetical protein